MRNVRTVLYSVLYSEFLIMWSCKYITLQLCCICVAISSFRYLISQSTCGRRYALSMAVPYVRSNEINNRKEKTPPPPINQYIRCDPVRLIAPKIKAKVIAAKEIVESTVSDSVDINTKSDDDDEDNDDEDEDDEEDDSDDTSDDEDDNDREEMLGIYSLEEALQKADSMGLDLVLINDKADPPVCKIIDYGKFKYSVEKKKKANAKKQIKGEIKELKLSYKIDTHDFDVKVRAALKFISNGDRVSHFHYSQQCSDCIVCISHEPSHASAVGESSGSIQGQRDAAQRAGDSDTDETIPTTHRHRDYGESA